MGLFELMSEKFKPEHNETILCFTVLQINTSYKVIRLPDNGWDTSDIKVNDKCRQPKKTIDMLQRTIY